MELFRKEACITKLQYHVRLQKRQLVEVQQRLDNTKNENISDKKCKGDRSINISLDDYAVDSSFQDNTPVGKSSSRICMSSSTVEQHEFNDWVIIPITFENHTKPKKFSNILNIDRESLFENNDTMDYNISRSSDESSKDSGVSSELQNESQRSTSIDNNVSTFGNEDKCTQTCVIDENSQFVLERNIEQIDCADLNKRNYQETLHVAELSQDLETIRDVIYALNEADYADECQLLYEEGILERLRNEEKSEIVIKRVYLFKMIENKTQEYKREICELMDKLAVKEENKNRISKCLERYIERCKAVENKISLMRNQLDKTLNKCAIEHLPKIKSLEEEVLQKSLQINELEGNISEIQNELAKGYECFIPKHVSSEALNISSAPSEDSIIFFYEKNDIGTEFDNESYQTDNSIKSNVHSSVDI